MVFNAKLKKNKDGSYSIWIFEDGWVKLECFYELEKVELE